MDIKHIFTPAYSSVFLKRGGTTHDDHFGFRLSMIGSDFFPSDYHPYSCPKFPSGPWRNTVGATFCPALRTQSHFKRAGKREVPDSRRGSDQHVVVIRV